MLKMKLVTIVDVIKNIFGGNLDFRKITKLKKVCANVLNICMKMRKQFYF